jgi:hypothetical protein
MKSVLSVLTFSIAAAQGRTPPGREESTGSTGRYTGK